ncbi:hypothetical protein [Actimicrobium sp. CCI2.3]|uniref:hypothetical protein n=1 Tax=Actimicrobium sp. CCI2.3 TaxID=3048616 RepID=UPI002AB585EA|nr:hypothetical protein [Actimicrobium sp. CCI2.3]MDY7576235.1 hypothetical protein [Actimicrobium sp. CCI2.3]MEB0020561.1 hypothetical protein [Actimicrobium sp. CCI2.3]
MKIIRYTLLADGSSDMALIPIINWLITQHFPDCRFQYQTVRDLGKVGSILSKRISAALILFPCEILFVHRDAENQPLAFRREEIMAAANKIKEACVPIVPVRMTEAWLLSDEAAIRAAANNRNGRQPLDLPKKNKWESLIDAKQTLFDALASASGKSGRALLKFHPDKHRHRITELTEDFSSLRGIPSFDAFEESLIVQFQKVNHALD